MKKINRYVFKSRRLKEYDYGFPGAYFVTVCVKDRKCLFGEVGGGKMVLNKLGMIADTYLLDIPNHFENTEIAMHVVMPNHVHAIVNIYEDDNQNSEIHVGGRYICHLQGTGNTGNSPKRQYQKLPVIISTYKAAVTRQINKLSTTFTFKWQRYFHDHIIRNEKAMENIFQYIQQNPENWEDDLENEMYLKNIPSKEREKKLKHFYKNLMG